MKKKRLIGLVIFSLLIVGFVIGIDLENKVISDEKILPAPELAEKIISSFKTIDSGVNMATLSIEKINYIDKDKKFKIMEVFEWSIK